MITEAGYVYFRLSSCLAPWRHILWKTFWSTELSFFNN